MLPHLLLLDALETILGIVLTPLIYIGVVWVGTFIVAPELNDAINGFLLAMFSDTFGFVWDMFVNAVKDAILPDV